MLCSKARLPVSGTKAELVTRLLSAPTDVSTKDGASPAPALSTSTNHATSNPSLSQPAALPSSSVTSNPTASSTTTITPSVPEQASYKLPANTASDSTSNGTGDQSQKAIDDEIARRAQRAQRFGITASDKQPGSEELKKLERAKKFGCPATTVKIDALDRPLGERGAGRKKTPPPAAPAAVSAPSQADLEWEERKRKRAEKFGIALESSAVDVNKKAKA